MVGTTLTALAIDDVLAGTFPASDPPPWTPGIARPAPATGGQRGGTGTAGERGHDVRRSDVIDLSRPTDSERTFVSASVFLIGAAALAVVAAFVAVAATTLVVLGARGVLEAADRIAAMIR